MIGIKETFTRLEVHGLIYQAVKDALNREREEILADLDAFLNVKWFAKESAMYKYISQIREKWEKRKLK